MPHTVEVLPVVMTGSEATVLALVRLRGEPQPRPLLVTLAAWGDCWQVRRVAPVVAPQVMAQAFYSRYLQAMQYAHAFQASAAPVLRFIDFPAFMAPAQTDAVRRVLTAPTLPFFDPLLQTDHLPQSVTAELLEQDQERASVRVYGVYPDGPGRSRRVSLALLEMALRDGRWLIEQVRY